MLVNFRPAANAYQGKHSPHIGDLVVRASLREYWNYNGNISEATSRILNDIRGASVGAVNTVWLAKEIAETRRSPGGPLGNSEKIGSIFSFSVVLVVASKEGRLLASEELGIGASGASESERGAGEDLTEDRDGPGSEAADESEAFWTLRFFWRGLSCLVGT